MEVVEAQEGVAYSNRTLFARESALLGPAPDLDNIQAVVKQKFYIALYIEKSNSVAFSKIKNELANS